MSRTNRRRGALALALLLVASSSALSLPGTAGAAPASSSSVKPAVVTFAGSGSLPELTPAQAEDVVRYAKQIGVDAADELEKSRGSDEFAELVESIEGRYSSVYVDAAWAPSPDSPTKAWIAIREQPAAGLVAEIEKSGIPLELRVTDDTVASAQAREAATETVHHAARAILGSDDVSTTADSKSGIITVTANRGDSNVSRDQLVGELTLLLDATETGLALHVELTEQRVYTPETKGGMLWGTNCTAGFTVFRNSAYGITSAAHCSAHSSYGGFGVSTATTSAPLDIRVSHYTSATPTRLFQYVNGAYRNATSSASPVAGALVCAFGYGSVNYGGGGNPSGLCSTVLVAGSCTGTSCSKVITNGKVTVPGDSGGPWYNGNAARGLHTGEVLYGGSYRSTFARIGALGILQYQVKIT